MTTSINAEVLDTHALVWYLENNPRLSSNARVAFSSIEQGYSVGIVPVIAFAELMHISERKRTRIQFAEALNRVRRSRNFQIAPFNQMILNHMRDLSALELHDRIIVATALAFRARLITRDRNIHNVGVVECLW